MSKTALIIKREYMTRVRKKSFILMSILGPVLMAALMIFVIWMGIQEDEKQKVLVIDDNYPTFSDLANTDFVTFSIQDIRLDDAKAMFYKSDYTAILYIPENVLRSKTAIFFFKKQPSIKVQRVIENKIERVIEDIKLRKYNIQKSVFDDIRADFQLNTVRYKKSGVEEEVQSERAWVGFVFGLFIYMFIFMYGVQVMRGVIEEKTSRIIEVIISSAKPFQLMMGKIIGVALVGLTQFLIWVVLTFTIVGVAQAVIIYNHYDSAVIQDSVQLTSDMMQEVQSGKTVMQKDLLDPNNLIFRVNWILMLGMFLFYFLGGYFLYSAMFAAIGSAVDNDTDTQQFMLPVTIPLVLAYIMSVFVVSNPEGPAAFWFSIIPFTSPIVMMVRLALGFETGDLWQLYLSMFLLIVTFVFITWLAGRIYRTGILMYGKKASWQEMWKWLFYKNSR